MPLEALRDPITPLGLHYLLIHFDIPQVDAAAWRLRVGGLVERPLAPQHGYPLRVIVPGWYGMTHVKWLAEISVVAEPFRGWQQEDAYKIHRSDDDPGTPVTRIEPHALLVPPGIPDFLTRVRFLAAGPCVLLGRARSGWAPVERVEVSVDGGATWEDAVLEEPVGKYAWRGFIQRWDAQPGEHVLRCRA